MRDPALFEKSRLTLARWRKTVCVASQPYLEEWERLMNEGVEACLAVALEDSPAGSRVAPVFSIFRRPEQSGTFHLS